MSFIVSKKSFLFFALASALFFSCKKEGDDNLEGRPEEIIDDKHVSIDNQYGISAIFPINEWTNSLMDTFPLATHSYYDPYRSNAIFTARLEDKNENGGYDSEMFFYRFFEKADNSSEAEAYTKKYYSNMYEAFMGLYYTNISNIEPVQVGRAPYEAQYFEAQRDSSQGEGIEHVYLIYNNKTIYGVNIHLAKDKEENLSYFTDILKTLKLE